MGFERSRQPEPARVETVTTIVSKTVRLNEDGTEQAPTYSGSYIIRTQDAEGNMLPALEGNLVPELTPTQRNNAQAWADSMFAKAVAEALPAPLARKATSRKASKKVGKKA